jgi:hypothetical protein
MLARVSAGLCSVCGAALRDGVCPNGHPQRASRLEARTTRGGFRRTLVWVLVLLLISAGVYAALVWYPRRAAADLMRPSSEEFAAALNAYRSTVATFPPGRTDPQALIDGADEVVTAAGAARQEIGRASAELEQREPVDLPVVSSRPPLRQAVATREGMQAFYASALETVASLEGIAGYVTSVAPVLPQLDNLEQRLGRPTAEEVGATVAAATPIADQVVADLRATTPPEQLGGLHASLVAIAQRIRADIDELARAGQQGSQPVVNATIQEIRAEITSFRETLGGTPRDAANAGLEDQKAEVDRLAENVITGLETLRDTYGITGLTVPPRAPPPTTAV